MLWFVMVVGIWFGCVSLLYTAYCGFVVGLVFVRLLWFALRVVLLIVFKFRWVLVFVVSGCDWKFGFVR